MIKEGQEERKRISEKGNKGRKTKKQIRKDGHEERKRISERGIEAGTKEKDK